MAIDFPSSPTNGQLYTNPATGMVYAYSTTYTAWQPYANSTIGYTGSRGDTGYVGSVGYVGSSAPGYSGSIGYTGSTGDVAIFYSYRSIIM